MQIGAGIELWNGRAFVLEANWRIAGRDLNTLMKIFHTLFTDYLKKTKFYENLRYHASLRGPPE